MRAPVEIHQRHEETLDDAVREINIAFGKSTEAENKAHNHRVRAGHMLIALRSRIEAGEAGDVTWWKWYVGRFARSRKDAEKVMTLASAANPEAAAEEEREQTRERVQRIREERSGQQPQDTAYVRGKATSYPEGSDVDWIVTEIQSLSKEARLRLFAKLEEIFQWRLPT